MTSIAYKPVKTYSPIPSAFQLIEYPTRYVHDEFIKTIKNKIRPRWQTSLERTRLLQWLKVNADFELPNFNSAKWYVAGMVVYPLVFCGTPLTILADMIVGIAETAFCFYHGFSRYDLLEIAKRKIIVSPTQQLMYLMMSSAVPAMTLFGVWLKAPPGRIKRHQWIIQWVASQALFWYPNYSIGQQWIGQLPRYLNYHRFNIFIGGGAKDQFGGTYQRSREEWEDLNRRWDDFETRNFKSSSTKHFERAAASAPGSDPVDWKDFLKERFNHISRVEDPSLPSDYAQFKKKVFAKSSPLDLLNLKPDHSEKELREATKKYYLALHPDQKRKEEAEALTIVLTEAISRLRPPQEWQPVEPTP
ncbi:MAG: J domain-containing protein [Verrucomicrobia bacterium]|nr:J domain-containing protein [Verrucomicrobiota bacterium]